MPEDLLTRSVFQLLAQQALARKLGLLREAVRSALEQRLSAMNGESDALKRGHMD